MTVVRCRERRIIDPPRPSRTPAGVASTPRLRGVLYGHLSPGIPFADPGPGDCPDVRAARTAWVADFLRGGPNGPLNVCIRTRRASRPTQPTGGGSRVWLWGGWFRLA
uniref:Uncharacterized protein n=1 Tax=Human herpesvirus 1 TaxID=10298 RepID=A0A2Z4GZY3_HHV1|nr:hypothetical protein [Human alphaherpesvirus 1]